jgi:DNA ligase (NAD+)
MAASAEQLAEVTGIGPIIAESIATWFSLDSNRAFVEKLRRAGVDFGVAPAAEPDLPKVLEGKAVVVSGTLAGYTRDEAMAAIVARGGSSPGSVSAKSYALVVGDNPGASKVTKAEKVNVPVLDEAAFERLLETGEI